RPSRSLASGTSMRRGPTPTARFPRELFSYVDADAVVLGERLEAGLADAAVLVDNRGDHEGAELGVARGTLEAPPVLALGHTGGATLVDEQHHALALLARRHHATLEAVLGLALALLGRLGRRRRGVLGHRLLHLGLRRRRRGRGRGGLALPVRDD